MKKNVLVVDDNEQSVYYTVDDLEPTYDCLKASSIADARAALQSQTPPDIVVCDLDLSGMMWEGRTADALIDDIKTARKEYGKPLGMIVISGHTNFGPATPEDDKLIGKQMYRLQHAPFPVSFIKKGSDENISAAVTGMIEKVARTEERKL